MKVLPVFNALITRLALLIIGLVLTLLLSGCGEHIDPSTTSSHEQLTNNTEDTIDANDANSTVGTYKPYMGKDGLGFGIDMGGGVVLDPSTGNIGMGF